MSWVTKSFNSTLGQKLLMSLTGLFLILFLIGHVSGNMLLLKGDGGQAFNEYATFMTTNTGVIILSYLTYLSVIGHVVYAIILSSKNKSARPVKYDTNKSSSNSTWSSRNMGVLGTIILIFLVIHLQNFWYEMHWGGIPKVTYESGVHKDLFTVVTTSFSELWIVGLYVVSMIFLGFHLYHGFASAFQTLGLNHKKYTPAIKFIGSAFAIVVPALFALMPIFLYISSLN